MKHSMYAMIYKDFRGVVSNRRLFASLLIVPIVLTVLLPSIFVIAGHFTPDDPDLQQMLSLLPESMQENSLEQLIHQMLLNYILPVFFLMIPIMTASIMAASSFVGEKEKRTLETLLYAPLTLKEIFRAKVLACFLVSMLVSLISFAAMLLVLETELFFLTGSGLFPGISWLVILLLVSPAISLIAITLIVRQSAKAKTVEESQQGAVFLIIPIVLLAIGQFTGVLMLSVWVLLGLGVLCALVAGLLLKRAMGNFTYEKLLS
ncbi:MAG TPA: ABC transporter permease [Candidatus Egerieicola faecale]|uniref:ABC transporter permease n=1 Tax=Candidatus Egerieicola faecale TaxID=2840774 RepID=A0A9D1IUE9_9FIRM|nr:ABC transporter permease [Candidatus Egerieicola faecale]